VDHIVCRIEHRKAPRGKAGTLLYLDFDGVLHHEAVYQHPTKGPYIKTDAPGHQLFQHVPILEELLAPYPDVQIVLSTSWAVSPGFAKAAKKLPMELRQRCIGSTYHSAMDKFLFREAPRGMQVWADVLRRQPRAWLALDDDWLHWPKWALDNFVQTHPILGISAPEVRSEIEQKMKAMFPHQQVYSGKSV